MDPTAILIVDDHAIVRHGLRIFLDSQPDLRVAHEAASGEDAVSWRRNWCPTSS
jgi:DNA-binding NarL/FixJ family response regulator